MKEAAQRRPKLKAAGRSELIIKIAKLAGDERGDARVREIA
jgi:hypothetical protein